jgi:hypothetical protein
MSFCPPLLADSPGNSERWTPNTAAGRPNSINKYLYRILASKAIFRVFIHLLALVYKFDQAKICLIFPIEGVNFNFLRGLYRIGIL